MAFEPGGIADKLGNRYEKRWCVKQLLRLLSGEIVSVTFESAIDGSDTADLTVRCLDGRVEHQQCKAQNGNRPSWTFRELQSRGVLPQARKVLQQDPQCRYAFVSATPATGLADLTAAAQGHAGPPDSFHTTCVAGGSKERQGLFVDLCKELSLSVSSEAELAEAVDLLRRTEFILHPLGNSSWADVKSTASLVLTGNPEVSTALLSQYVDDNLRTEVRADRLLSYLREQDIGPRQVVADDRLATLFARLNDRFCAPIRARLIHKALIPRSETATLLDLAVGNTGAAVVVLHGVAGTGKSGVLLDFAAMLSSKGAPHLALRLDSMVPISSTTELGKQLGLPGSPVMALGGACGDGAGVLILDQLDALRWTAAHSRATVDLCSDLLREVVELRSAGKKVCAVLACRTFDLEHDPSIGQLAAAHQQQTKKVAVGLLDRTQVDEALGRLGDKAQSLSTELETVLRLPQNLSMWVAIRASCDAPPSGISTRTQLMRRFWRYVFESAAKHGVPESAIRDVLDVLLSSMEADSLMWVPSRLLDTHRAATDTLHSLGVLQTGDGRTSFCHQSYYDFRVADRVLSQSSPNASSLLSWLGGRQDQLLFRREQLALALSLLCDEQPAQFVQAVDALLADGLLRFHLKHVALAVLGEMMTPSIHAVTLAKRLLAEEYWRDHVAEVVIWRHPAFVAELIRDGTIARWLSGERDPLWHVSVQLLRSVSDAIGDMVAEVLEPFVSAGRPALDWALSILPFSPCHDSERLFVVRLQLFALGYVREHVEWGTLLARWPLRALKLMNAILDRWEGVGRDAAAADTRLLFSLDSWEPGDSDRLRVFGAALADEVIAALLPGIDRLTTPGSGETRPRDFDEWLEGDLVSTRANRLSVERGFVEATVSAARGLAAKAPERFFAVAARYTGSGSRITQEILLCGHTNLDTSHADRAIAWLLESPARVALGSGFVEPRWALASRLVLKHSPHCSDELFVRLEDSILRYHEPTEKSMARDAFFCGRHGVVHHWFGRAQYHLLPALDPKRISSNCTRLLGELKRKFDVLPESEFLDSHVLQGGMIVSPLSAPWELSDAAWLGIVSNQAVHKEHDRMRQLDDERAAESTVRTFSGALASAARTNPERFGQLALRFPPTVDRSYVAAVIGASEDATPPNVPHVSRDSWAPASVSTIEALLQKFPGKDDDETAMRFCWLVSRRADEEWSSRTVDRLADYAVRHPNPTNELLTVYNSTDGAIVAGSSAHSLELTMLNSVRGAAVRAIAALLWRRGDLFARLMDVLSVTAMDSHPAVRMATVESCLPALRMDHDAAVGLFVSACESDPRVTACSAATPFLNAATSQSAVRLAPLVAAMLSSGSAEVARQGAREACARWLFHGVHGDILDSCLVGTETQRAGVAEVAASFLSDTRYSGKCLGLLKRLLNDESTEVRKEIAKAYHNERVLLEPTTSQFVMEFIGSEAFLEEPTPLLHALEHHAGQLLPFADRIRAVCVRFVRSLAQSGRDLASRRHYDATLLGPLVLRLYEEARDSSNGTVVQACLDCLDLMLENRVGVAAELMRQIHS